MKYNPSINKSPFTLLPYIIILLILWIISGWNTKNGDLESYEDMYLWEFSGDLLENLDVGFMYILSVFKNFGCTFKQFHIYIYLIYISFIGLFIFKASKNPIVAIFIYILLFFFRDCITLRNSLADIFLLLSLYYYTNKEAKYPKLYFVIGILLAGSIHISFLAFLILLFSDIKINYKLMLGACLLLAYGAHGILSSIVSMDLFTNNVGFQNKYDDYLSKSSWFSPIMASFTLIMNYILVKKSLVIKKSDNLTQEEYRLQKLLNISSILFVVVIFSSISMVTMRYFYNFFMFSYIFIYNRLYCENIKLSNKLKNVRVMYWCVVTWVFLWLVYFSNVSTNIPVILNNNSF